MNGLFLLSIACRSMKNLLFKGPLLRRATKVFYIGGLIGHAQNPFYSRLPSILNHGRFLKAQFVPNWNQNILKFSGSNPRTHPSLEIMNGAPSYSLTAETDLGCLN